MKRKLINKIILALTVTLMTMTSFTVGKYITLKEQKNIDSEIKLPVSLVVRKSTSVFHI